MLELSTNNMSLSIDVQGGAISSIKIGERTVVSNTDTCPLFRIRLRDKTGEPFYIISSQATKLEALGGTLTYSAFGGELNSLLVNVLVSKQNGGIEWQIQIDSVPKEYAVEWVEFPKVCMPRLIENDENGGKILFPYNEGMLVSNESLLPRYEPEFPSSGAYFTFPNMVCSQFMAYLFDEVGLYFGAHDNKRALKCVDFYPCGNMLSLQMRLYTGADFGQGFKTDYPILWKACTGDWRDAADIYRGWFEQNLPTGVLPTKQNPRLPEWYENQPLIVTYPVRGIHDMDKMEPNALFPYTNALPILEKIKEKAQCRVMSLLMHWEGTAPWAPPYVWPPFGGVSEFNKFRDALHKNGDLLGVYCSGFGYTQRSTLIDTYVCDEKIKADNVLDGVCRSPADKPELGITCCPYQRYGYDICPASAKGRQILDEAYSPLFESGADYAQILDQNHGGGQYLCYARNHNHPPMPGEWMTSNMQSLLSDWGDRAPNMLFGCESAAAEPFIGYLMMSDNRFELNYPFGLPVPVFAYVYHEYIRNFMGNQCGCPFEPSVDTLRYRLAYSFSIGDIMTLILSPNGNLMSHWGTHDFENCPDMEKALTFIKNLMNFYRTVGKEFLYAGRMKNAPLIECDTVTIPLFRGQPTVTLPRLLCSTWDAGNGKTAYIVVNPEDEEIEFKIAGQEYKCPALDGVLVLM